MIRESGTSLDALRARRLTSFQLRLLAASTGCPVTAAEADARAVVERLGRDPVRGYYDAGYGFDSVRVNKPPRGRLL